jgi:hypothetical protein
VGSWPWRDRDVKNLLDFMLYLLRNRCLSNPPDTSIDIKKRARRLMFKIISNMPVVPPSLMVTQVRMPAERDYIGSGGFGRIFKGELQGNTVALKVLYRSGNNVVSPSCRSVTTFSLILTRQAFCREALMWGLLKHKFLLPFLGIYVLEGGATPQFFLVSPYMKNGTLAEWRKKANPSAAEIERLVSFFSFDFLRHSRSLDI